MDEENNDFNFEMNNLYFMIFIVNFAQEDDFYLFYEFMMLWSW